jgi:hypothetical protein
MPLHHVCELGAIGFVADPYRGAILPGNARNRPA